MVKMLPSNEVGVSSISPREVRSHMPLSQKKENIKQTLM